jgi:hypothetical protein
MAKFFKVLFNRVNAPFLRRKRRKARHAQPA